MGYLSTRSYYVSHLFDEKNDYIDFTDAAILAQAEWIEYCARKARPGQNIPLEHIKVKKRDDGGFIWNGDDYYKIPVG